MPAASISAMRFVADVLKLLADLRAARALVAQPFGEILAGTSEKARAHKMFFKGDGSHRRSVVWRIATATRRPNRADSVPPNCAIGYARFPWR